MTTNADEALAMVGDVNPALRAAGRQLPLLTVKRTDALETVYAGLPADVVTTCVQARGRLRHAFIEELRKVRDVLAPSGRFKDWCAAIGINYGTAKNRLGKPDSNPSDNEKLPGSLPDPKPAKPHKLAFTFTDKDDQQHAWKSVQRVMEARNLDRGAALLYIFDVFEGRVLMLAADATAITQADATAITQAGEAA